MRVFWLLWIVFGACGGFAQADDDSADVAVSGFAYADKATEGSWVYREDYIPLGDQRVRVVYRNPDGETIAVKTLDYTQGLETPSFEFHDMRFDRHKSAKVTNSDVVMSVATADNVETDSVKRESQQVVDAGFTHFIRAHWQSLVEGERVTFYFALPNRLTNVKLQATSISCEQDGAENYCFELTLRNRFLALFVDTLTLEFDEDKKLVRYQGRSNLSSAQGGDQDVTIVYQYFDPEQRL